MPHRTYARRCGGKLLRVKTMFPGTFGRLGSWRVAEGVVGPVHDRVLAEHGHDSAPFRLIGNRIKVKGRMCFCDGQGDDGSLQR